MLSEINTMGLNGIDGFCVRVQTDIGNGMPSFSIIGLAGQAVKEAQERARAAIKNSGFQFPAKRITINLAPASQRKDGSHYDLAIAVSVLCAAQQVTPEGTGEYIFIGELSLDGAVNGVNGVLAMVISAYEKGYRKFIVPAANAYEAGVVDGTLVYPVKTLAEAVKHLNGEQEIQPHKTDISDIFSEAQSNLLDMADVKGQEHVKRALEIAASGNHNVMMIGPAGTGKSMLAKRISGILPDMTFEEALEVTKVHSIAGTLPVNTPLITKRPFRSPHHTVSAAALSGGGSVPRPGELSLAHLGTLFLDEALEFSKEALEVLRQPLEDGKVTVSRVNAAYTFPCNIMLVCAMNPCKCGNYGNPKAKCTCTPQQVRQYRSRMSGPLLDRIDIQVEVPNVSYDDLSAGGRSESSAEIKERVKCARAIQTERYKSFPGIYSNSQLSAGMLQRFCRLGPEENALLKTAFESLGLSARAHSKVLKVARTIADLDGGGDIKAQHIAEAISYRNLDRREL